VQVYRASEPISITGSTTVKARLRTATGLWSGLVEATFDTPQTPGDFDSNGVVEAADYLVWRTNFGSSVPPGTLADGNGDGAIDAADYVVWRKNVGSFIGSAQGAPEASVAVAARDFTFADTATDHQAALSEPMTVFVSSESENTRDLARPFRRTLQFRPGVRGPTQQSGHDPLLIAQDRPASNSASDSSLRIPGGLTPRVDLAAAPRATEYALDEMFSALGESKDGWPTAFLWRTR
jgi:hypothetical protein